MQRFGNPSPSVNPADDSSAEGSGTRRILGLLGLCGVAFVLWFVARSPERRTVAFEPASKSPQDPPPKVHALAGSTVGEDRSAVGLDAAWLLLVIDPDRRPIPDAQVLLGGSVLAVSGSDGKARIARSFQDASGGLTPDVCAEGYVSASVRLRSDSTEEEVVLAPSMRLFGRVVCKGDGAPVAGVLLVAIEAGRPWSRGLVPRLIDGGSEVSAAETLGFTCESDADGSFRFHDLPAGVRYEVLALGDGLASPMGPVLSPAGGGPMEVVVERLRGVAVDFVVDGSGGETLDPRIDFSPYLERFAFRGPPLQPYLVTWAAEDHLGIPVPSRGGPDRVLVFSGGCELLEESWLELPIGFPGYASTTAILPLQDVRRSGWTLHEVALLPIAERWGPVQVRFAGVPLAALARMDEDRLVGVLHLKDPEGRDLVRLVVAKELAAGIEFELPVGDYELDFEANDGYLWASENPAHALALSVAEGDTARATIDVSTCGFTEFHAMHPSGIPFTGRLIVEVNAKGMQEYVAWVEPPYTLSLVPEGKYEARLYLPGLIGRDLYPFEVRRGELTHLWLDGIVGEEPPLPGR